MSIVFVKQQITTSELCVTSEKTLPKIPLEQLLVPWSVDKLQRVQNSLARIVKVRKKYDHITPVLSELHWLSIDARIRYKIAVLTFKALTTNKPIYLAELISIHRPVRELRSSSHNRLHVQIARTVFGSCAFCHAAPAVWNGLPPDLTDCLTSLPSFKSRLETLFFSQLFRRWSRYWSASAIRRYFHNFVDIGRVTNCVLILLLVLAKLHWLPIQCRIQFKLAVTTYKALTTQQPSYLADLLQHHVPIRQLRSSSRNLLREDCCKLKFADRAFRHAAPTLWNSLPSGITSNLSIL